MLLDHGVGEEAAGLWGAQLVWQFRSGEFSWCSEGNHSAHVGVRCHPLHRWVQMCWGRGPSQGWGPRGSAPWALGGYTLGTLLAASLSGVSAPGTPRGPFPAHGTRVLSRELCKRQANSPRPEGSGKTPGSAP